MRKKKSCKCLIALALSITMLIPAQPAYATEEQTMDPGMEAYAESRAADGFEIEDGVLKKYTGTAKEVVIPEEVTCIDDRAFFGCSSLTEVSIPKAYFLSQKALYSGQ